MMVARGAGGRVGEVGEDLSLTMYFFTDRPTQIYTSQPFSLHCNRKSIHVAGDHHGSRQNIRLVRTVCVSLVNTNCRVVCAENNLTLLSPLPLCRMNPVFLALEKIKLKPQAASLMNSSSHIVFWAWKKLSSVSHTVQHINLKKCCIRILLIFFSSRTLLFKSVSHCTK